MPLFICDECGCVENTVFGNYWTNTCKDLWKKKDLGRALCSQHAPTTFKSGKKVPRNDGKWHGEFKQRKPTKKELATSDYFHNRGKHE